MSSAPRISPDVLGENVIEVRFTAKPKMFGGSLKVNWLNLLNACVLEAEFRLDEYGLMREMSVGNV